jgi:hypothetical protein
VNTPKRPVMGFCPVCSPPARASRLIPGRGTYAPSRYAAMMAAVNINLWRSSGTFQAFARDPNISISPVPRLSRRPPLSSLLPTSRRRAP